MAGGTRCPASSPNWSARSSTRSPPPRVSRRSASSWWYPAAGAGAPGLTVAGAEFEGLVGPLLEVAVAAIGRTVAAAGVEPAALLLTGGTTRIPLLRRLAKAALPVPVAADVEPVHGAVCVA